MTSSQPASTVTSDSSSVLLAVGIAASAGGLSAVSAVLNHIPPGIAAFYVLAQHMSPTHRSHLTELLSREAKIRVVDLEDDTVPEADTLYVTPPKWDSALENNRLRLRPPSESVGSPKPSADRLFSSIAQGATDRAVGIVLSGTGSDGAYGVQQLREFGGITIVQEPESAGYDGMPLAAIQTGCVDLVLPAEEIGTHLKRIAQTDYDPLAPRPAISVKGKLDDIFVRLEDETGINFREYKESTIFRRINRRMRALGIPDYEAYARYVEDNTAEVFALQKDLTISVTSFFRDPEHFEQLRVAIEGIVAQSDDRQIRVWVVGCATGEEAYTIAILFAEALGGLENFLKTRVLILATDVDQQALETARRGVYPNSALDDVAPELREKYFRTGETETLIHPILRAAIVFSPHNVFADPPFLKIDLITARNVLIYFKTAVKRQVMQRFHYALRQDGYLFLGTSEALSDAQAEFESVTFAERVFVPRALGQRSAFLDFVPTAIKPTPRLRRSETSEAIPHQDGRLFEALVKGMSPNAFIATATGAIVRVFGDITPIAQISDRTNFNFNIQLLKSPFYEEALSLSAVALRQMQERFGTWHSNSSNHTQTRMRCVPIINESGGEAHVLFVIETRDITEENPHLEDMSDEERLSHIREIEAEMLRNREVLQQTLDELQTSNEELQSMNEELQSAGEEMQATNEQLQTSNEELQSANEELITVNEEMHGNSTALHRVSEELSRTMEALPMIFLMVDNEHQIKQASHLAIDLFELPSLVPDGVPLYRCKAPPPFPNFGDLVDRAINDGETYEDVITNETTRYLFRVLPYKPTGSELSYAMISMVLLPSEESR